MEQYLKSIQELFPGKKISYTTHYPSIEEIEESLRLDDVEVYTISHGPVQTKREEILYLFLRQEYKERILSFQNKEIKMEIRTEFCSTIILLIDGIEMIKVKVDPILDDEYLVLKEYYKFLTDSTFNALKKEVSALFPYSATISFICENGLTKIKDPDRVIFATNITHSDEKYQMVQALKEFLKKYNVKIDFNQNIGYYEERYDAMNGQAYFNTNVLINQVIFKDAYLNTDTVKRFKLPNGFKFTDCVTRAVMVVDEGVVTTVQTLISKCVAAGYGCIFDPKETDFDTSKPIGYVNSKIYFPNSHLLGKLYGTKIFQLVDSTGEIYLLNEDWTKFKSFGITKKEIIFTDAFTERTISVLLFSGKISISLSPKKETEKLIEEIAQLRGELSKLKKILKTATE